MDQTRGEQETGWKFFQQRRYVVAFLAFLGFFNVYSLRVNLSVGIVAMTSARQVVTENGTQYLEPHFNWDSKAQGLILSSFFYGYICTQLLGGWLGTKYGGATVYGIGVSTTALLTLVTPLVISTSSYYPLVALRIIEGLFEGVTYPCMHAVWAKWAPPRERASMATFAYSGSYVGTVIVMPLSGLLAENLGWPSIFYITGIVGLIWASCWWLIVKNTPEDDDKITPEELKYLQESLGDVKKTEIVHPWKDIFKSMPVWAIVMAHFCENWGFYTLLTQLPTFMKDTLNFDITKAGVLASLPYLVMAIIMQFAGRLSDLLCNKKVLSVTNVRKMFNCGAFLSQTIFMILAAHIMTAVGVTTCLVLAVGLGAFAWPAFSVNHLDIAPQHASVLMGISNTFATLPGILSPLITGFLVTNRTSEEWEAVFYIAGTLYLLGAIFYAQCSRILSGIHSHSQTVAIGSTLKLQCLVNTNNLIMIKWFKDGEVFCRFYPDKNDMLYFKHRIQKIITTENKMKNQFCDKRNLELEVDNVTYGGIYTCHTVFEAAKQIKIIKRSISVLVYPITGPYISGIKSSYKEGEIIQANCTTSPSNPPPSLVWYINGVAAYGWSMFSYPCQMTDDGLCVLRIGLRI